MEETARRTRSVKSEVHDMALAIAKALAPQYTVTKEDAVAGAVKFLYDAFVEEGRIEKIVTTNEN